MKNKKLKYFKPKIRLNTRRTNLKKYKKFIEKTISEDIKYKISIHNNKSINFSSSNPDIDFAKRIYKADKQIFIKKFETYIEIISIFGNDGKREFTESEFLGYLETINDLLNMLIAEELRSNKLTLKIEKCNSSTDQLCRLMLYYKEEIPMDD
jgi:hypothetical protein